MTTQMQIKIGCDPELFIKKKTNRKSFSSAHGIIPGTKVEPFPVNKGAVQVDGMALEFNIDPATTEDEFVENITAVVEQLRDMVPTSYEFHFVPSATFTPKVMASQPKEALEMGCDTDYNGYTGEPNPRPDATGKNFRTAGGHIHLGWTEDQDITHPDHMEACRQLARQLDWYIGLPLVLIEDDDKRRSLYGAAACFRPKSYGMEYRTPSNVWLQSPELMRWVFRAAQKGFNDLVEGHEHYQEAHEFAKQVIECPKPSENMKKFARNVCKVLGIDDPSTL